MSIQIERCANCGASCEGGICSTSCENDYVASRLAEEEQRHEDSGEVKCDWCGRWEHHTVIGQDADGDPCCTDCRLLGEDQ